VRHTAWIVFALLALSTAAAAQSGSKRLGVVNGQAITEDEVSKAAAKDLDNVELKRLQNEANYRREKQDALEKAFNALMEEKVLDAEAAKRKISKEALVQQEVDGNVKAPTTEEIEKFYEENKARIPVSREQAIPQIGPYLMDQRRDAAFAALITRLKKDYGVTSYLEPLRTEIPTAGFPTLGPASAPITIVEFSDFECPYCGGLFPTLKEIETKYADKIRVVYRQYPLTSLHPHAQKAAEASLCADEQKRFWDFHDSLFGNQQDLTVDSLKRRAVELKLDAPAFNTCLDSGKHAETIKKDIVEGSRAGVSGTPAIFINGRLLSGNQPYTSIAQVIEDELQRKSDAK
jgi:predicted DsbA family dithiol-disulfide isomerase/Skp family chaperone for outer membrane proteins